MLGCWSSGDGAPDSRRVRELRRPARRSGRSRSIHRLFPREGWGGPARRLARYVATRRDEVEGYALTFPDHWAAYGLAELGPAGLGEPEIAYARELAGILGLNSRLESQSGPDGLRRLLRGEPASGAGLGTVGEGLAQLWRLSLADPRLADLAGDLDRRLRCTAGRIVDRQRRRRGAGGPAAPARARRLVRPRRLHADGRPAALSACSRCRCSRRAADELRVPVCSRFVAAVNPCRLRLALPARRDAVALGALVALAGVAAVAAVRRRVPRRARHQPGELPARRGGRARGRGRPRRSARRGRATEPELRGLGAALVPVAFPLLLQPGSSRSRVAAGGDDVEAGALGARRRARRSCSRCARAAGDRADGLLPPAAGCSARSRSPPASRSRWARSGTSSRARAPRGEPRARSRAPPVPPPPFPS